jgi:hypothetical protein
MAELIVGVIAFMVPYLFVTLLIGILAGWKVNSVKDYVLAGVFSPLPWFSMREKDGCHNSRLLLRRAECRVLRHTNDASQ